MSIKDGWFSEDQVLWPGQKFSLEVRVIQLTAARTGAHRATTGGLISRALTTQSLLSLLLFLAKFLGHGVNPLNTWSWIILGDERMHSLIYYDVRRELNRIVGPQMSTQTSGREVKKNQNTPRPSEHPPVREKKWQNV